MMATRARHATTTVIAGHHPFETALHQLVSFAHAASPFMVVW